MTSLSTVRQTAAPVRSKQTEHYAAVRPRPVNSDPNADVARSGTTYNEPGVNPIVSYMRCLPRAHEPGSTFHYNTGETHLVGMVVSKATGKSLADYASEKIWKPFGMERDAVWMLDAAGRSAAAASP